MSPTRRPPSPYAAPPRRPLFAPNLGAGLLAGALAAGPLVGCRGVLGIDELDPATGSTESDAASPRGGSAGAGGGGKAGSGGKAGGGPAGKAGAAGAGGGVAPADPRKACQQRCADGAPAGTLESYYGAVGGCACSSSGEGGYSCDDVCTSCDLSPGAFAGASSLCVACITARQTWGSCQDEGEGCDGACEAFADCIRNCGFGDGDGGDGGDGGDRDGD
jgi:hypothetical protein